MSDFPTKIDDDVSLPRVDNNITEEGQDAINALRDAAFALEGEVGIGASGTAGSISQRLGVSLDAAGNIKASALVGLGLITLPITNIQIAPTAGIAESKLALDYKTATLYNIINNLNTSLDTALNFVINHGSKLEPHLQGVTYRHVLNQIDIDASVNNYFKNKSGALRDNTNLYTLLSDINTDFVTHEKSDSTSFGSTDPSSPSVGTVPPTNYSHVSSGIFLNTNNFSFVPQTATDLQQFAQFIDNSNIFILGTRIQTLYQNGISRASRSPTLTNSENGQSIVPTTLATAYHLNAGSSAPVDNINQGDDIIQFFPTTANVFDSQFSLVKIGDIITINYGPLVTSFIIREVQYVAGSIYAVRINGKNLLPTTSAQARIDRPLFNTDKYGVLALAQAQPVNPINGSLATLITGNPRGAEVLGIGFNPELIDSNHYNLFLLLYPTGNPADSVVTLAPIDVSGNHGQTPGQYTLDSIVESTNAAFRSLGFNYRFIAFSYQGNFGLMLADAYNNVSFSIISGFINSTDGTYNQTLSNTVYPNNIIGLVGFDVKDALGFGSANANLASPVYSATFTSVLAAQNPTKIFAPLKRKTYYVNGVEREKLNIEPAQLLDVNGDGFWNATIVNKAILGSRIQVTYQVNSDLSSSGLKIGKTIVVQPSNGSGTFVDFGRFFIENIQFNNCDNDGYSAFTTITVFDGVHGTGVTPYVSSNIGTPVTLYFSGDSIGFNSENISDFSSSPVFKRYFEVFINEDGYTFTNERGRINVNNDDIMVNGITLYGSAELSFINIYKISPKLRGYSFSGVKKINLQVTSYNAVSGLFSAFLCAWDGTTITHQGPVTVGKKGQIVRFYDETNIDYIDFIFNINDSVPSGVGNNIDIQLFPTLSLDDEVMMLGSCQVNDLTQKITYLKDLRQFGNVSENQLSTSALDYIASPARLLNENAIIRGFDITAIPTGITPYLNTISINGGVAVINGKIVQVNNETIAIPVVQEWLKDGVTISTITWFICVNDKAEFELIASTDFDPLGTNASVYNALVVDHTRLFTVQNPNLGSPVPYIVRGSYLSDIVEHQKDVTIIGTITTTVSAPSSAWVITSATVSDARRFATNGYGGLSEPFILGTDGSFRSFTSLNTWLTQLTKFKSASSTDSNKIGTKVIVKGNFPVPSTVTLDYAKSVIFEGDGSTFNITANTGFLLGNNVELRSLKFDYNVTGSGNLVDLTNACIQCNVTTNKNLVIDKCIFTALSATRYSWINFVYTAETNRLQNVIITNNRFDSTDTSIDKNAAIVFAYNSSVAASLVTGPRLTSCKIENNLCNKNQAIIIGCSLVDGGNNIQNALVTVNTSVKNNICGAIGYLNRRDVPMNTVNGSFIADKENSLVIEKNVCRFIYTATSTGLAAITSLGRPTDRMQVFTGFVSIIDNTVSWIHTGVRVSTAYAQPMSPIIIKGNQFTAFDPTYLNIYYTGTTGFNLNIALIVSKVTG